ncbi:NAPDH-dependent diflavin reductase, partial [Coemansia sp. RSA 1933]
HYLGADGALDPWLDSLWPALLLLNDQSSSLHRAIIPDSVPPPPSASVELGTGTMELQGPPEPDTAVAATLVLTERITTPDHFQDVRHLQFRTDKDVVSWNPGDCAVLRPSNTAQDVDAFLAAAHWTEQADSVVRLESSDLPQWVPRQTTLRWLSTYYFDIAGVPRRSFFELLGYFSPNTTERERLQELGSTEGQDDLHAYCMRPRRTVTETLADFPATPVPLAHMLDVVPMIAERSFSISSSSQVDLTVAVVEYRTMMQLPRRGVCSRWLASLAPGASVHLRVARGLMHLPRDAGTPVLMVGPGTGIAAFMAFIEARPAANYLFFGCRSKIKDFYYRAQLEQWCTEGRLRLFCAFSRDSGEYVQHRIREQGELVWSLLDRQGASVYVSGNANRMPQD